MPEEPMFPAMEKDTEELKQIMFIRGARAAIKLFAWWKDGIEYVGCGHLTLKQALEELDAGILNEELKSLCL